MDRNGYPITGRTAGWLDRLIAEHGDSIAFGIDGDADRGDRHSQRAEWARTAANRKETPMTETAKTAPGGTAKQLKQLVGLIRTAFSGDVSVDPVDQAAPRGTQVRRIAAYNALHDLAKPGRDRYCGYVGYTGGPCVLFDGHRDATFTPDNAHMDAEQRERALRYLVHSEPDPAKRA